MDIESHTVWLGSRTWLDQITMVYLPVIQITVFMDNYSLHNYYHMLHVTLFGSPAVSIALSISHSLMYRIVIRWEGLFMFLRKIRWSNVYFIILSGNVDGFHFQCLVYKKSLIQCQCGWTHFEGSQLMNPGCPFFIELIITSNNTF